MKKEKVIDSIEKVLEKTIYADGAQLVLDVIVLAEAILTAVIAVVITGIIAHRGVAMLLS